MLPLILWLGILKLSTMTIIVGLNTSGPTRCFSNYSTDSLKFDFSFYWGTEKIVWDLAAASRDPNGAPVR